MTEAEVRGLIRQAILEVMGPAPRRALVVFSGGLLGFEDCIGELRMLAAQGVQLDYLQTPSAERILDQDLIASVGMREVSKRMVEEHDMLIAPTLTANIAAKVAHGIADCRASNLFSEFIMSNRLVVASRTAICPDGAAKQSWFPHMPPGYADMLRGNLAALASFGVRLTESRFIARTALAAWDRRDRERSAPFVAALGTSVAGFAAAFAEPAPAGGRGDAPARPAAAPTSSAVSCTRSLISQQVVQQLPAGVELRISRQAKVTAAARDAASARSIRISREV
ncbi:MAG: flavoprotein domain protein [Propionibacteriaceae bacterium]|nr:flavoprotein domain protein [Propionibacteriaceae bacterium]